MPIYEYRCADCGFQEEHLQKISEPPLKVCPSCGKASFEKLLSAAGFQLKGSGWYATDFKGSGKPTEAKAKPDAKGEAKGEAKADGKADAKADAKTEAKSETSKAETAPSSSAPASGN
jgi:putative FmdB family regulatory protein